ncbi:MAG: AEC family transporter [Oscillospiraceae bacterium]|nr:AEC family transporter [Oscillospiraceae bacterium]
MDTLIVMLKNVLIFVLLAVPGYLLVKGKLVTGKDSHLLSKLLTYVGMPALILSSTLKLEFTGAFTLSILVTAVIGTLLILGMFLLTALLVRDNEEKRRGMLRFCMIFANNGFIGLPLAKAVFGEDSPVMAYLIILNIIMNLTMFTLGTYLVSGDKKTMNLKKALLTPVLLGFLAGIALNLLGVSSVVPELQTYATHFSGIVTPLSMLVLGIKLAEVPMKKLFTSGRMYYTALIRLILFPILCVAVMLLLHKTGMAMFNRDMVLAFFIAYAMPTAGLASAFADQHKGDGENAVICTLGTTVLSIATIPVLFWVLTLMV